MPKLGRPFQQSTTRLREDHKPTDKWDKILLQMLFYFLPSITY